MPLADGRGLSDPASATTDMACCHIDGTLMLPSISFLTGVKATEPKTSMSLSEAITSTKNAAVIPNKDVSDSAASRKSEVGMALSFVESMVTPVKDFLSVSNHVPPGG